LGPSLPKTSPHQLLRPLYLGFPALAKVFTALQTELFAIVGFRMVATEQNTGSSHGVLHIRRGGSIQHELLARHFWERAFIGAPDTFKAFVSLYSSRRSNLGGVTNRVGVARDTASLRGANHMTVCFSQETPRGEFNPPPKNKSVRPAFPQTPLANYENDPPLLIAFQQ